LHVVGLRCGGGLKDQRSIVLVQILTNNYINKILDIRYSPDPDTLRGAKVISNQNLLLRKQNKKQNATKVAVIASRSRLLYILDRPEKSEGVHTSFLANGLWNGGGRAVAFGQGCGMEMGCNNRWPIQVER